MLFSKHLQTDFVPTGANTLNLFYTQVLQADDKQIKANIVNMLTTKKSDHP